MTETEYLSLCEKYLKGEATSEETILIKKYQDESGITGQEWIAGEMGELENARQLVYSRLQESLHPAAQTRKLGFRWQYAAAAAILIFISAGLYFVTKRLRVNTTNTIVKNTPAIKNKIIPGSNKAVLTLADGSHIVLDSAKKGILSNQGNTAITKAGDGRIVYNSNNSPNQAQVSNRLNTISIPRGGKYQIVLPDGTRVWLNSSSTLTFPAVFTGNERDVQLTGEAYFEVAKNKEMPFKVKLNNNTEVRVLGTHFNITAYDDDAEIKTTLLEGSVKLTGNAGGVMLIPGQQGVIKRGDNQVFKVLDINTSQAVAWKNGNFAFDNEDIKSIMKKVSRWYDVDIEYSKNITDRTFTGTISQFENISEVLKLLQLTGAVHFKIEERRVYVMQ